ncbi:MAG TPA: peptidoglycan-binding domain-containing protein [Rhodanobacter sp.]|nr:peptidoglycan-binding domain-containing protein [Rhodanobacter sp.]
MRRLVGVLAISIVALAPVHGATAADQKGEYGIRGAGLVSCQTYNQEREARSRAYDVIGGWIDGYITGINQYAGDTYDAAPFETTELYAALVSEYCKKQPETTVFAVVNSLIKYHWKDRLLASSPKAEVVVGKQKVMLYVEVIRQIQQRLSQRGFYHGKVADSYEPAVQKAMGAFQSSIHFKPTGFPDEASLWQLFTAQ